MINRFLKNYPLFVFLLPLFFVGHGFAQYQDFIPIVSVAFLAMKYLAAAALLFLCFLWWYKDRQRAWFAVFTSFFIFLFFGAFHDFLHRILGVSLLVRYSFLLPVLVAVYLVVLYWIGRKAVSARLVLYLNLVLLVLILVDLGSLLQAPATTKVAQLPLKLCDTCAKPDVHFIVVDGYAGREQLEKDFAFSNAAFLDSLQKIGFHVLAKSRSNYVRTEFSLASILNMDYHHRKDYSVNDESLFYCYRQITRNKVVAAFQQQGYEVINNSIFDIENRRSPVRNTFLVTGTDLIQSETLLARLRRDVYIPFLMTHLRNTSFYRSFIFQALESDKALAANLEKLTPEKRNKPRFVYTHFLMTHFPYYYQANGRFNKAEDIRADNYEDKDLYLGNLQFASKRLLSVVHDLLLKSPSPPVILMVSDHGFRYATDPANAFSALSAVYLPGRHYEKYYDSLSGVNQFRVLLNSLFQQRLPLLPDRNGEVPAEDQKE